MIMILRQEKKKEKRKKKKEEKKRGVVLVVINNADSEVQRETDRERVRGKWREGEERGRGGERKREENVFM